MVDFAKHTRKGRAKFKIDETSMRLVLVAVLDWQSKGRIELTPWQRNFAEMKVSQAHYSARERKAIVRLLKQFHGEATATRDMSAERNTPGTHENVKAAVLGAGNHERRNYGGSFKCGVCKTGKIFYHVDNDWKVSAVCSNRECIRYLESDPKVDRRPRFGNIMPQDIGTFLVESETNPENFYAVDAIEQTCACDDSHFRGQYREGIGSTIGHKCKHLLEVNYALFEMRAF